MASLIGRLLLDRYQVVESIGRGGMAEVYKVWDQQRAPHLAMKLLRDDMAEDRVFLRRFTREAQTLANLQHPNIVRFYGMEQEDLLAFILMDYVEGYALRTEIFRLNGTPMRADRIRSILQPVCSGLHYAHSMGMVHCDLKPANIMIDKHRRVMLTDFGIARMTDAATATMVGAGTPAYMAPEQARGLDPLPQTDIYAMGVVLYEMLTGGERPFVGQQATTTGSTSEKVRWEQIYAQPPSPRRWNPDISPDMEAIIIKCLSKEPEKRYKNPLDLLNAVEMVISKDDGISPGEETHSGIQPPISLQAESDSLPEEVSYPRAYQSDLAISPWWKKPIVLVGISLAVVMVFLIGLLSKPSINTGSDPIITTPRHTATAIPTSTSTPNPNFNVYQNSEFGLSLAYPKEWIIDEYEGDFSISAENEENQMVGVFGVHYSLSEIEDGDIPIDMDIYSPNDWIDYIATDLIGADGSLQDQLKLEISGYPAAQAQFYMKEGDETYYGYIVSILDQNDVAILLLASDQSLWIESQALFEEIIDTVKIDQTMTATSTLTQSGFVCDDPFGCVSYGPSDPIRIASALVISGPNTDLGLDSQYGVEVAINLQGELLGHEIKLQAEDDGCSAAGGQAAGQKIVSDPSIVAVVGTSCSGAGVPMSEVISEAGYVMISPSNTAPALTDPDQAWNPGYLRVSHNDKVQGPALANFAYNILGVTTAAAIHDGDPYTEGLARSFAEYFEELGGTIVEFTAVNKGDSDMRPVLSAVAAAGPPELLYYPVFTAEGGFLTNQAREVSGLEETILAAADGMISSAAIRAVGEAGEGMYFSGPDLSYSGPQYDQLLTKYKDEFGSSPHSVFHAHAFDAANMIFACIEKIGIKDGGYLHIGRQALRTCLYNTSGFNGITGTLTCNEYGDCADPKISISQLNNGYYERIWP